jgi:hypothetical protein
MRLLMWIRIPAAYLDLLGLMVNSLSVTMLVENSPVVRSGRPGLSILSVIEYPIRIRPNLLYGGNVKNTFAALVKKAAAATFLAGVLVALVPSFASATTEDVKPAPAPGFSLVDPGSMPKVLEHTVTDTDTVSPQAVFDCLYSQGATDIFFDCLVYSGAIQIVIFCGDGNVYFSPWFPGPAQWLIYGTCGTTNLLAWGLNQQ